MWRKIHFDIVNRLGVDDECDGQTDRTAVSITRSNDVR